MSIIVTCYIILLLFNIKQDSRLHSLRANSC